uniref:Uncharacterized protein n=1 Tax=Anguilla anguilla TaxID=7936 RepID=A0A0E9WY93_ANGAN
MHRGMMGCRWPPPCYILWTIYFVSKNALTVADYVLFKYLFNDPGLEASRASPNNMDSFTDLLMNRA